MPDTARYALPLLSAGQAQKEITHNEALIRIDALLHLAVASRTAVEPATPAPGAASIVPAGAVGDWAGQDGRIASFDGAGWTFLVPSDGCIAYVGDEAAFVHFAGGSWRDGWPVPALVVGGRAVLGTAAAAIVPPTGGQVVDAEARATLAAILAALRSEGLLAAT